MPENIIEKETPKTKLITPKVLQPLAVFFFGILIVCLLIWLISSESASGFEEKILRFFRHSSELENPWGSTAIEEAIRDLTALGSILVTTLLAFFTVVFLFLVGRSRQAIFLSLAFGLGTAYVFLVKLSFNRPRPEVVSHIMESLSPSFPSGHSASSSMIYLMLAFILTKVSRKSALKQFVFSFFILLIISIGISRIYLGVHWPTDVLGGWVIGVSWVATCWLVEKKLVSKGLLPQ